MQITACSGLDATIDTEESFNRTPITLLPSNIDFVENESAVIVIPLDKPAEESIEFSYNTQDISAVAGDDYIALSDTLSIERGDTQIEIPLTIIDDNFAELTESFKLRIQSLNQAVTTPDIEIQISIIDNDNTGASLTVTDISFDEATAPGMATITITSDLVLQVNINFDFESADVSATAGIDYTAVAGSLSIPAGQTNVTIQVPILADNLYEIDETFDINFSNNTSALFPSPTATITISDDEVAPTMSISDVSVAENVASGNVMLTVSINAVAGQDIDFEWITNELMGAGGALGDSPTAPLNDFQEFTLAQSATITTGNSTVQIGPISIYNDSSDEDDESFEVFISNPTPVISITDATAVITINDEDSPPAIEIAANVSCGEAGGCPVVDSAPANTFRYKIQLAGGTDPSSKLITFDVFTDQTGGATDDNPTTVVSTLTFDDYQEISNTPTQINIPAGSDFAYVDVTVIDDVYDEPDESFELVIANPINATLGTARRTGTIQDNDVVPGIIVSNVTVGEADGTADVVLTLSQPSEQAMTYDWSTIETNSPTPDFDSAEAEDDQSPLDVAFTDYNFASGTTVTFPIQTKTIQHSITIINDSFDEYDDTFKLLVSNLANMQVSNTGDDDAVITITDNDTSPTINLSNPTLSEDAGPAITSASLSTGSARTVTFNWNTSENTATDNNPGGIFDDFQAVTTTASTITRSSTNTSTSNLSITLINDNIDENDEDFSVSLSPTNSTATFGSGGTITIQDDVSDTPVQVTWTAATQSVSEGTAGVFGTKRIVLVFDNSGQTEALTNFPVLVKLNSTRIDYADTQNNGEDIRFFDSDGTTPIPHEIEEWNEAGQSIVWVKIPQIDGSSNTDFIYMNYDDPNATDGQSPENVWNDSYVGVWHMDSSLKDSTKYTNHGVDAGTGFVNGVNGPARNFNTDSSMEIGWQPEFPIGSAARTMCVNFQMDNIIRDQVILFYGLDETNKGFFLKNYGGQFGVSAAGNIIKSGTVPYQVWQNYCGVYDGSVMRLYVDGVELINKTTVLTTAAGPLGIGKTPPQSSVDYDLDGRIDETRISNVARSTDWLMAENLSIRDSFITYGTVADLTHVTVTAELRDPASPTTAHYSGKDITIPVTVDIASTATNGLDHNAVDGNIAILAESATSVDFKFFIYNDTEIENPDETVVLNLATGSFDTSIIVAGSQLDHTLTITSDDSDPIVNFSTASQTVAEGDWFDGSWSKRRKISINANTINSNLEDFPLLVKVNSSNIDYASTQDSGQDIRFTDLSGRLIYPHEIENWDESGDSFVWVKIPHITPDKDNYLFMYYGNAVAIDGQDKTGTWDEHFRGVYHLNSDVNDSSVFAIDGTNIGSTAQGTGKIGGAYIFNGTSQYIDLNGGDSDTDKETTVSPRAAETRTYCGWTESDNTALSQNNTIISTGYNSTGNVFGIGAKGTELYHHLQGSGYSYWLKGFVQANAWFYLCASYTGAYVNLYFNGLLVAHHAETINTNPIFTFIGKSTTSNNYWDGSIDEVRISDTERNSDWIRFEFESTQDQVNSFYPEESSGVNQDVTLTVIATKTHTSSITVPFTLSGDASNPSDHNLSAGNITIIAGQTTASQTLTLANNASTETDETLTLTMGTLTNGIAGSVNTHTITIIDDDKDPVVNFAAAGAVVLENHGALSITAQLDVAHPTLAITVPFTISTPSLRGASNPEDHDLINGNITISATNLNGSTTINIQDDNIDEFDEKLTLTMGTPINATAGNQGTYTLYIKDNDALPALTVNDDSIAEDGSDANILLTLNRQSSRAINITYSSSQGSANSSGTFPDYTAAVNTTLTIPAYTSSENAIISVIDDPYDEYDTEGFSLIVSDPQSVNELKRFSIADASGAITITDDEVTPTVSFNIASLSVIENGGSWWDADYSDRVKLRFKNGLSTENLSNFPILVKLNGSNVNYANILDAGEDLRFIDANGTDILSHEIEEWNEAGDSYVWVKVPQIDGPSSVDFIWLYYGNNTALDGQTISDVWDSNYKSVWHLNDQSINGGTVNDATANATNGIFTDTNASSDSSYAGISGKAIDFTGDGDNVNFGSPAALQISGSQTMEAWIKVDSYSSRRNPLAKAYGGEGTWTLELDGTMSYYYGTNGGNGTNYQSHGSSLDSALTVGTWYYLVHVRDLSGMNLYWYIDGKLVASTPANYGSAATGSLDFLIGDGYTDPFNGKIDEVRVSNAARSASWINAQQLSMTDQFIDYTQDSETPAISLVLSGPSEKSVTADLVLNGASSASNPEDHNFANNTVNFSTHETSKLVLINLVNDAVSEADETIILDINSATDATTAAPTSVTITVLDDDNKQTISIANDAENEGTDIIFNLTSSSTGQTVDYTVYAGTATEGVDYDNTADAYSGSITFDVSNKTVSIATVQELTYERTERFYIILSNPSSDAIIIDSRAYGDILNDDPPPDADFALASSSVAENSASAHTVAVNLSILSTIDAVVAYTISGTTTYPEDHDLINGSITIAAGQTSGNISFTPVDDSIYDEGTVVITMGVTTDANQGTTTVHTVTITDSGSAPNLSIIDAEADEETGTMKLTVITDKVSGINTTFNYSTTDGTATTAGTDYTGASNQPANIPAGSQQTVLSIAINSSDGIEADETFTVSLSSITGATGLDTSATATILDADSRVDSNLSSGSYLGMYFNAGYLSLNTTENTTFLDSSWISLTGLEAYYNFDGTLGLIADSSPLTDASGNNVNGTTNDGITDNTMNYVAGRVGQAAEFDGTDDYISLGNNLKYSRTDSFSIGAWVKIAGTGQFPIISSLALGPSYQGFELKYTTTFGDGLRFNLIDDAATNDALSVTTAGAGTSINDDQWHYVFASYDASGVVAGVKLYIDGMLMDHDTTPSIYEATLTGNGVSSENTHIGARPSLPSDAFDGEMDELTIWSRTLSELEVYTIYQKQKVIYSGQYISDVQDGGAIVDWQNISWFSLRPNLKPALNGQQSEVSGADPGYSFGAIDGTNNFSYHSFDEADPFEDNSGNANTLSCTNCPSLKNYGRYGKSYYFDGIDDALFPPNGSTGPYYDQFSAMTVSVWVTNENTAGPSIIMEMGGTVNGFALGFRTTPKAFIFVTSENSNHTEIEGTSAFPASKEWIHVVGVFDAGQMHLYINGIEEANAATGLNNIPSHSGHAGIGYKETDTFTDPVKYWKGMIDDVLMYNRALSATEVQDLYRRGALRTQIQVRSCADLTCSTNPTWTDHTSSINSFISELNSMKPTQPKVDLIPAINSEYFQYRVLMESDDGAESPSISKIKLKHD